MNGVFEGDAGGGVIFHPADGLDAPAITKVQTAVRRRLLRAAKRRVLLSADDVQVMGEWEHGGGFSVNAEVRIEAHEREGLERLLRYCARPAFALERLREVDPEHLVYESVKPGPGGSVSLMRTPKQLLDRLAALIPPPRRHRHRYYGWRHPTRRCAKRSLRWRSRRRLPPHRRRLSQPAGSGPSRTTASPSGALRLGVAARPHL